MSERSRSLLALGAMVVALVGLALSVSFDPAVVDRAQEIGERVKCPVCQGESIADSSSEVAGDMMALVEKRVTEGASDEEIIAELLSGYSGALLLEPRFEFDTAALWLIPALVLVGGAVLIWRWAAGQPAGDGGSVDAPSTRRSTLATVVVLVLALGGLVVVASGFLQDRPGTSTGIVAGIDPGRLDDVGNETLEAVIAANLDHPEISGMRFALAERYFEEGAFGEAFEHYFSIMEDPQADTDLKVQSLTRVAWMTFVGNGDTDTARRLLDEALSLDPGANLPRYFDVKIDWCVSGPGPEVIETLQELTEDPQLSAANRATVEDDLQRAGRGDSCL